MFYCTSNLHYKVLVHNPDLTSNAEETILGDKVGGHFTSLNED